MKTPEEIKKGLECCTPRWVANHWKSCSSKCPYITLSASCRSQLVYDALAYIQQLERKNKDLLEERELNEHLRDKVQQLERERDAAVEDLGEFCYDLCKVCMYSDVDITNEPCKSCDAVIDKGNWQWCGVKEDNNG